VSLCVAADAAEARGEVEQALRIMESHPVDPRGRPFWRPWRLRRLRQLSELRAVLPAWATSRWLLELALQDIAPSGRDPGRRAMTAAIAARGGRPLPGVDEIDARCKVMDHDWVYRHLYLYEHGGLSGFLHHAAPELVAGADRVHEWATAPMRSLRLVSQSSQHVTWEDVGTTEQVTTLNTGCAALLLPGECALGRVVPIEHGAMFETAPLRVPGAVAAWVADEPAVWVDVLAVHNRNHDLEPVRTHGLHEFGLLSDVPRLAWRQAAADVIEPGSPARKRFQRSPDVDPQAQALVAVALDPRTHPVLDAIPPDRVHPWSCVAAALVEPGLASHLAPQLGAEDAERLRRLGDRLAEPASAVCRQLAAGLTTAA
jgi:hypothetical protein